MCNKRFQIFIGSLILLSTACSMRAQETGRLQTTKQAAPARFDVGKSLVEAPLEKVIGNADSGKPGEGTPGINLELVTTDPKNPARSLDVSKTLIENSPKKLLAPTSLRHESSLPISDNPKCKPGLVTWHANLQEAKTASRRSGKPILLFQLLGKLDETFT